MDSPFLDTQGRPIPQEEVLGNGASAVVVLRDGLALKMPLRYSWSSQVDVDLNIQVIRFEQDVYRRLQSGDSCHGIVDCLGFSSDTTQLAYMEHGDLRTWLQNNRPSRALQLSWFRAMAATLAHIHRKRVLVADIATRNFLLDSDLSIRICDFSEASVLPLDSDMDTADDNGYTTQIDIGQLGAVIYEVVTGHKCDIDLFKDNLPSDGRASWPQRKDLPNTEHVWLGSIIEGCWADAEGFKTADSLLQALDKVHLSCSPRNHLRACIDALSSSTLCFIQKQPFTSVAAVLGTFTLIASWAWRRYR